MLSKEALKCLSSLHKLKKKMLVLREIACKDRTWKWLVLIRCNACEIGNQTWWLIKDWSQYSCVLSLLEFEWCFRFTRSVLCSPPIQDKRKTWTIVWSNGKILVCRSWFKKRRPRGCWAPGSRHTSGRPTIVWSNGKDLVCRSRFKKRRPRGCWAPGSRHTRRRRSPPKPWGRPVIWGYLKLKAKRMDQWFKRSC